MAQGSDLTPDLGIRFWGKEITIRVIDQKTEEVGHASRHITSHMTKWHSKRTFNTCARGVAIIKGAPTKIPIAVHDLYAAFSMVLSTQFFFNAGARRKAPAIITVSRDGVLPYLWSETIEQCSTYMEGCKHWWYGRGCLLGVELFFFFLISLPYRAQEKRDQREPFISKQKKSKEIFRYVHRRNMTACVCGTRSQLQLAMSSCLYQMTCVGGWELSWNISQLGQL